MNYVLLFITIFLFSTLEVVSKLGNVTVSPFALTAYRFIIGSIVLLPFAYFMNRRTIRSLKAADFLNMAIPGILNVAMSMFFLHLAVHFGKASLSAILISSNPIFVSLFAMLILKEKLGKGRVVGLFLGIFGLSMIMAGENMLSGDLRSIAAGLIFGILAAITFGLYTVLSKKHIHRYGSLVFNSFSFLFGAFALMLMGLFFRADFSFSLSSSNIIAVLYLGIILTGLGYFLFMTALRHVPASAGSMMFFLKPVIASLLAYFFLKEMLHPLQIIGAVLIIAGIGAGILRKKSALPAS